MDNLENLDTLKESMKINPADPGLKQQIDAAKDVITDLKEGGLQEKLAAGKEGLHEKLDAILEKLRGFKIGADAKIAEKVAVIRTKVKGQFASDPVNELMEYVESLPTDLHLELKTDKTHLIIDHKA